MKKIAVIINPTSGGGRSLNDWPRLETRLIAAGYGITKHISSSEQDLRASVRAYARRFTTLGICGGDSSLTIAAEELAAIKFKGELVFLPAGSVNDIVIDIDEQQGKANAPFYLGELCAGNHRKQFIGQANWGLGVVVNRWVGKILRVAPLLRKFQEGIGTLCIIFAHLLRRDKVYATFTIANERVSSAYSIILVTQIRHWASGLRFAPDASFYSPEFQVVAIRHTGLIRLVRIILAAKDGKHTAFPEVQIYSAQEVCVEFMNPTSVQIDGDILRDGQNEIKTNTFELTKLKTAMRLRAYH